MRNTLRSIAAGFLLLTGCSHGPSRAEVSGSVQLDGQFVEEGSIQFIPVEGTVGPSTGEAIRNGKYHISRDKGAVIGKNRVELRTFRITERKIQDPTGKPGVMSAERVQAFPAEYSDKSTVIKEIKAGSNVIDFDVYTPGKKK
jgi:hypothetical protein